ncbi:hypothetical protein [Duganella sp. LjRoot269]|uniref:hypothetical protein n=1 Tax=Duganella sp. LjRoot269 TaxID=3342305 RepID=UPI003ECD1896
MKYEHCLAVLAFAVTSFAHAVDTSNVIARGHKISVGDSADSVFSVLKKEDMVSQDIEKVTNGLKLTKRYSVNGKSFTMIFARTGAEGPYMVTRIDVEGSPTLGSSTVTKGSSLASAKAFEGTEFYRKYKPKKDSWKLTDGDINNSYLIDDTENAGQSVGIEITEAKAGTNSVSVSWTGASNIKPARMTKTKEAFLTDLLHAASPTTKAEDVIKYIKRAGSKNYDDGSNAMPRATIGGLHMHSGNVGSSLIVGLER